MTVRVEILNSSAGTVRVALYYPVPPADFLASAADPSRHPAGTRLSPAERSALQAGRLIEHVVTITVPAAMPSRRLARHVERAWAEHRAEALAEYRAEGFRSVAGYAWDGSAWSPPP